MPHPVVGALLSLVLSTPGAPAPSEEIVLSLRSSGAVLLPVSINGQGPFTFLLDTGAGHTVVSSELVDRLQLPVVAKAVVSTAAGDQRRLVVKTMLMVIGGARVDGLLPSVVPVAQLRDIESRVDGLVGQDFLSAFNYTLDYRRKRLRWSAPDADDHVRLPLVRAGDRSLVQLAGHRTQAPVLLVPDSGSEVLVVFERNGQTAIEVEYLDQPARVSAIASQLAGRGAVLRDLKVGAVSLRNRPAVVLTGGGSKTVEGDGLLPLHQFSSVSFNNREGWMVVR